MILRSTKWKVIGGLGYFLAMASMSASAGPEPNLTKGQSFRVARAALIVAGWKPRVINSYSLDGTVQWNRFGESEFLAREGYREVEYCSGTGLTYCFFDYVRNGKCLHLETKGERHLTLIYWDRRCVKTPPRGDLPDF